MIIDSITILGLNCNNCPKLIDMGLSVKWADSNIGISNSDLSSKKYGDYFAWGELNGYMWDPNGEEFVIDIKREPVDVPKTVGNEFNTSDYKFGFPPSTYTESGETLNGNDDIATVLYGEGWSIPKPSQWEELFNNCNIGLDSWNGVSGLTLTSNINGNKLSLPFIGYASAGYGNPNLGYGDYWTNTNGDSSSNALKYSFSESSHGLEQNNKWDGLAIRPIYNG